jgi:hypothetical protein
MLWIQESFCSIHFREVTKMVDVFVEPRKRHI